MFSSKKLKVGLIGLGILSTSAFADTLLIVSSGGGMFGGTLEFNTAIESAGAGLVESKIGSKYREVYHLIGSKSDDEKENLLKSILSERKNGEKMDVFSMQHGPDGSFVDDLSAGDVERILPKNFVGKVYTTSCNEYGDFEATSFGELTSIDRRNTFSRHMKRLGANEYMIHANMNATGGASLPFLLDEMSKNDSLVVAGKNAFDRVDKLNSKIIPELSNIGLFVDKNFGNSFSGLFSSWSQTLYSRPVLASKDTDLLKELVGTQSMYSNKADFFSVQEELLGPSKELSNVLNAYVKGGISESMTPVKIVKSTKPMHESMDIMLSQISDIAKAVSPKGDGCIDNKVAQSVIGAVMKSKDGGTPEVEELCLHKGSYFGKTQYTLSWKLSDDNRDVLISDDLVKLSGLDKIHLARNGAIQFIIRPNENDLKIRITGIRIDLNGVNGNGKLKGVTQIRPINAKVSDDGNVSLTLGPALRLGLATIGSEHIVSGAGFLKILGIKIFSN